MKRFGFIFLICLCLPVLHAEESLWTEAEALYQEGRFDQALSRYESLRVQEGTSAALEYNIGNTLMRLNRTPEAIAAYRRAQWLSPHDPDIAANLERARAQQQAQLPALPVSRRIPGLLSARTWQLAVLVCAWILGGVGMVRKRVPGLQAASLWILPLASVLLLVSAAGAYAMGPGQLNREAVAAGETLTSRFEPLEDATEHFSVPGGSVVEVLESTRDWSRIRVDGKTGWVPDRQLIPVGFD
jgi:tetratricopeptide (TPR) repeat protein